MEGAEYICLTQDKIKELLDNYLTAASHSARQQKTIECYEETGGSAK